MPHRDTWAEEVFAKNEWQVPDHQAFQRLFGHRITNPENGLSQAITALLAARPQQFRSYPIKSIVHDGVEQELGASDCLLFDGKSMSWQTATKTSSGKLDKNTVPYDLYFANGKPLRIDEDGTLSVTVEQDDTSISIDHPLKVRLKLNVQGVTNIKNLLNTRGAQVHGIGKQSAPRHSANVSIKSPANGDFSNMPAITGHPEARNVQQKKLTANNQPPEDHSANRNANDKKSDKALPRADIPPDMNQPNTFPQDARPKRPLPVPTRKSKEASKSSKPEQDLHPVPNSSPREQTSSIDDAVAPIKSNVKPGHDSRTSRVPQPPPAARDSTGSLSPVPPEVEQNDKQIEPATAQHISLESRSQSKPETDGLTSTARKATHTYGKSRGSKKTTKDKFKTKRQEEEVEDSESDSRSANNKRSMEAESGPMPEAKKSRTGELVSS